MEADVAALFPKDVVIQGGKWRLNLKNLSMAAAWGGTDGLFFVRHFMDLAEQVLDRNADLLIYSPIWPVGTDGRHLILKDVQRRSWTMKFTIHPPLLSADPTKQKAFPTLPTAALQTIAASSIQMLIDFNPALKKASRALSSYAKSFQSEYQAKGISFFMGGFARMKVKGDTAGDRPQMDSGTLPRYGQTGSDFKSKSADWLASVIAASAEKNVNLLVDLKPINVEEIGATKNDLKASWSGSFKNSYKILSFF